jgi:hypothetical protein
MSLSSRGLIRLRLVLALAISSAGASALANDAGPFKAPTISIVRPDWNAARADAAEIAGTPPADALAKLNEASTKVFPAIAASPVPVLLPFDTRAYLGDPGADPAKPATDYQRGFKPSGFFLAGPAGYDAVFAIKSGDNAELSGIGAEPVLVEISASTLLYDLPAANKAPDLTLRGPEKTFPNVRRFVLENYLRYAFEKYGMTYVVSISCFDGRPRARWISCTQADRVAQHFLNALSLAGGNPDAPLAAGFTFAARPKEPSPDFTYYPAGRLLPNTGFKRNDGIADQTVYANIRFPFEKAPSFANSQSFMNWGDCDQTGRTPHPRGRKDAAYRCRVNLKPLVFNESAPENYSYPWRDNFCEHRYFYVGQCPGGRGHQGQDLRPATCQLRNEQADRCTPYQDDVVAARDGMILRSPRMEGVYLTSNSASDHVRFRYMHMHPKSLDDDNVLSGRAVKDGEVIGKAGNFNRRDNLTTYHLHFELMVPTRDGWARVNPYMTLVASYERLIGARGTQVEDPEPVPDAAALTSEASEQKAEKTGVKSKKKKRHKSKKKRRR